jgi:HK97 family phage major capsid protein/HK97 family phage prohead protease
MKQSRAYSILEIKAVDDEQRIVEGIASTPTPDRMGDIVDPMGAKFALPMPLLWQHKADKPVGNVEFAKPTEKGIPFRARIASIDEAGPLKDRLDEAWQSVKTGLVRAVSIGFSILAYEILKDGGYRINEWEWLELSLVTIPANAEATIQNIRSIDAELLAATGKEQPASKPAPGVTGKTATRSTPGKAKTMSKKTIAEQISAFEATRAAKSAQMTTMMNDAAEKGETLDTEQSELYDSLEAEVKAIDGHLVRLRRLEEENKKAATPIVGADDPAKASEVRGGVRVEVKGNNLPKGTAFTRYAIALMRAKGNLMQAAEIAKTWHDTTPEVETVLKAAVAAGTTTDTNWAAPLVVYQQMASEFIELLRPATILGRIPGLRRVPFNISMPGQTGGSSVGWVGEGKPKPVSALAFNTTTLRFAKAAGIVVMTDELVRFSNPSAEAVVQADLVAAMAEFLDTQLVDPTVAAIENVSPASITHGVTPVHASGVDADAVRADVKAVFANLLDANLSAAGSVWMMQETTAMGLSMMLNALGQPEFPGITATGGNFFGLPVVTSQNPGLTTSDSPAGGRIVLAKASEIMLADDGQVVLDASREASLQMNSAPDDPTTASTVMVSLWQNNMVGLRAERWINWQKRRSGAVQYIDGVSYGDAA